jgi:hypothetical protein
MGEKRKAKIKTTKINTKKLKCSLPGTATTKSRRTQKIKYSSNVNGSPKLTKITTAIVSINGHPAHYDVQY